MIPQLPPSRRNGIVAYAKKVSPKNQSDVYDYSIGSR
jgi:hypothetical protein